MILSLSLQSHTTAHNAEDKKLRIGRKWKEKSFFCVQPVWTFVTVVIFISLCHGTMKRSAACVYLCSPWGWKTERHNHLHMCRVQCTNVWLVCASVPCCMCEDTCMCAAGWMEGSLLTFAKSGSLQPSFMSIKAIKRLSMWMEISMYYHIWVRGRITSSPACSVSHTGILSIYKGKIPNLKTGFVMILK